MAGAFWCIVEDDRQGRPKKGMAEILRGAAGLRRGPPAGGGLAAECVALAMDGDTLVATRPVYAGKLLARVAWARGPWVATLRPNVFRPADAQGGRPAAGARAA